MRWRDLFADLAPKARPFYVSAFEKYAERAFSIADITDGNRLEHFLTQNLHESGGLSKTEEGLSYSTPERLVQVFPKYFKTVEAARPYVRNPPGLANYVYANRMGNIQPGDGYRYRGRGMIQITGRAMYAQIGGVLRIDLVGNPDLVSSEDWCLDCACVVWLIKGCNDPADRDDIQGVTRKINGGLNGLEDREAWLERVRAAIEVYRA